MYAKKDIYTISVNIRMNTLEVKIDGKRCVYYGKYHISQMYLAKIPTAIFKPYYKTKGEYVYVFLEPLQKEIERFLIPIIKEAQTRFRPEEHENAARYIYSYLPAALKEHVKIGTGAINTRHYSGSVTILNINLPNAVYYIDPLAYTENAGIYKKLPSVYKIYQWIQWDV